MKTFILLLLLASTGFGKDFASVKEGEKSFFTPLTKGPKYIKEALSTMPHLNGETEKYAKEMTGSTEQSFDKQLSNIMVNEKQGKIVSYKEVDTYDTLNGNYVVKNYKVEFFGGKKVNMEIRYLRTIRDGGFEIVDSKITD